MGGTELQFFSYIIYLFFLPAMVVAFYSLLDVGEALPAAFAALYGMVFLKNFTAGVGYADFPVLVMGAFALCAVILWGKAQGAARGNTLLLTYAAVLSGGAAVTKQSGLVLLIFFPIFAWAMAPSPMKESGYSRGIAAAFAGALFIALPWYICSEYAIFAGQNESEIGYVMGDIHVGREPLQRFLVAYHRSPRLFHLALAALPALFIAKVRIVAALGGVFFLGWSILLSYDERNVAFALPFLGYAFGAWVACAWGNILPRLRSWRVWSKRTAVKLAIVCGFFIVLVASYFSAPINDALHRAHQQKALQRGLGEAFNRKVIEAFKKEPAIIVSSYQSLEWLPGFNKSLSRVFPRTEAQLCAMLDNETTFYVMTMSPNQELLLQACHYTLDLLASGGDNSKLYYRNAR
jgi:hypothetical protein